MQAKPQFISGYRGETDYLWDGKRYAVRYAANDDGHYNGNYYETGIRPFVGTVRNNYCADWFNFPPADLVAQFPGFVGARYTEGFASVEYDGSAPQVATDKIGYVRALVFARELADTYNDHEFYGVARQEELVTA